MLSSVFFEVIGFLIAIAISILVIIFATKVTKDNKYAFLISIVLMFKFFVNALALLIKVVLTFVLINAPPTHIHTNTGQIIYLSKVSPLRMKLANNILQTFDYYNIYFIIAIVLFVFCMFALYFTLFYKKHYKKQKWFLFAPDVDVYVILTLGLALILNYILHIVNIHIHNLYFEASVATIIMIILMPKKMYKAKLQIEQWKLGHNTIQVFALMVAYITSLIIAFFKLGYIYDLDCLAFIFLIFALADIAMQIIKIKTQLKISNYENEVFDFEVILQQKNEKIKISNLKKGQIYILNKNQIVPLKSKLISNNSYLSPLNINGENEFILKTLNQEVESSLINLSDYCVLQALENYQDSNHFKLLSELKAVKIEKTKMHNSGQKFVKTIIYLVAISAIIDFVVWEFIFHNMSIAINTMISIILLTCPCGIGTGLPILFHIYILKNLKDKIYVKNINVIEDTQECRVIAFDKTGTLTNLDFVLRVGQDFNQYEQIIKSLETNAIHPLSQSIVKQISKPALNVIDFQEHPLLGISGYVQNQKYYIGNHNFVQSILNVNVTQENMYFLFNDQQILTTFKLENKLKTDAGNLIKKLQQKFSILIISGDSFKNVASCAKKLNIKHFFAQLTTKQKAKLVHKINSKEKTIYVGDGQNDSLAMVNAHIGISFNQGSVLTNKYSDIVFLDQDISKLNKFIEFSKYSSNILKLIIYTTLIYNVIFIALASCNIISMGLAPLGEVITTIIILIFVSFIFLFKEKQK